MIKVGIIGGAGYTAGELCRLLLNHPEADIRFVNSSSNAGNRLTDVHEGLYGETDMTFTDQLPLDDVDVIFFCFGHGKSEEFLRTHNVPARVKIIDLAQDFRLAAPGNDYVYGLPELNREAIRRAAHVANPGCFATCIQLGLLPLASRGLLNGDIAVNAITGSTGAGVKPGSTTHFSWRNNNLSIYKPFQHQHVPEIKQSLRQLQPGYGGDIDFIPYRGDFARGIFATEVIRLGDRQTAEKMATLYRDFYKDAAFTHYVDGALDLKQVVNTNKALVHVEKYGTKLLVTAVIDNLLKGASGQAVQNMNLMFGLDECAGLRLKPSAF
ncbi:MAG: N-acetyl-gamma-glutamyl-phosphate reductase [Paraprevotella sp.]|nr:N-acetyl-gamma-glutamyl-phosphate reductase [Paraprevotella sp.]MBP3471036.1 N-acetyl-gamma-glutamyl-phosphate reductase [Paraprevotella sp.]